MKIMMPALWVLAASLFVATVGHSQSPNSSASSRKPSALICTLSSFFSFDAADVVGDRATIGGRGLVTCRNDQGFTIEEPVLAEVDAKVRNIPESGEVSFSANSSTFVIPRELSELQDFYEARSFSWASGPSAGSNTLLTRGKLNDLVIELKFSSQRSIQNIEVQSIRLRFDLSAPDFSPADGFR